MIVMPQNTRVIDPVKLQETMGALEHFLLENSITGCRVGVAFRPDGIFVSVVIPGAPYSGDVKKIVDYMVDKPYPVLFRAEIDLTHEEALKL
jgi:hypothetical protein